MVQSLTYPALGFGIGLRPIHYQAIVDTLPTVDWFEILTENFLVEGGQVFYYLDKVCENYPVVMHGVSLSVGSVDPLNKEYLKKVKELAKRTQAKWISDHLCWTGVQGKNLHDLMPLPYTEEALQHVVAKVRQVQDFLGQRLVLENVSSYVAYNDSVMTEWEFLSQVAEQADCLILLDINNIYVSAKNHCFSAQDYLSGVPAARIQQFHIAGHYDAGDYIIDTHDQPIIAPVWDLYNEAVKRFGKVSTLLERDDNIPAFNDLLAELEQAKAYVDGNQE